MAKQMSVRNRSKYNLPRLSGDGQRPDRVDRMIHRSRLRKERRYWAQVCHRLAA